MIPLLAAVFVLLALCCAIGGLYLLSSDRGADARVRALQAPQTPTGSDTRSLLRRAPSAIPALRALLSTSTWAERADFDLDRAHVNLRVGEYLLLRFFIGILLFALTLFVAGGQTAGILIGILLALVGYMLPALWLALRRRRRLEAIDRQLVEGLTHVSNAIRAGFAMLQAFDAAAQRLKPPLSEEFGRLVADVRLGASLEDALVSMGNRIDSHDLYLVITATLIQRSSGGNLSEILDNVTETIRERDRIRGEVRTFTAQQRFAAWVLSLWPIFLAFVFFLLEPDLMSNLWTETEGIILLIIAGTLQVLGFLTIRRIIAIQI
jgi:tight adherence protein B